MKRAGRYRIRWGNVLLVVLLLTPGCRHLSNDRSTRRTCVVLSVGGANGLAHLGAMDALRERGTRIDCVFGNSMGAVVGSLYATAPRASMKERYRKLAGQYEARSRAEAQRQGITGALLGAALGFFTGGAGLAVLAGGAGALAGGSSLDPMDNARFSQTLEDFFDRRLVEETPIPFATSYMVRDGGGLRMVLARRGSLAASVAASANNPFIFPNGDVRRPGVRLDPGMDRAALVPVHEACAAFPGARLIVINVTGEAPFVPRGLGCEMEEVRLTLGEIDVQAFAGTGPEFDNAYRAGFEQTFAADPGQTWFLKILQRVISAARQRT